MKWLMFALIALAGPAAAQSEIVGEMAGPYQIVPTDGSPACGIALTAERTGSAWRAKPDADCAARVRASKGVVAWRPSDGIVLLDARGMPAMTFVEDETALPSSPNLQTPTHYLVPRIAGYTHLPQPSELVGRWTLRRPGRAPCVVMLTATPAYSSAPRRGITLGKGCTGNPLSRMSRWSIEDMQILFWGSGDAMLTFAPAADDRYVADPGGWVLSR